MKDESLIGSKVIDSGVIFMLARFFLIPNIPHDCAHYGLHFCSLRELDLVSNLNILTSLSVPIGLDLDKDVSFS